MNLGNKKLELQFETAVKLLAEQMPAGEDRKKPILMHSLRVGMYLYERDYSKDIVIAGLLHDIIEWTESPEDLVRDEFGERVFAIVMANTKNREIEDVAKRREDYVKRCAEVGKDALIVKAADVLDSYRFYKAIGNERELERSANVAKLILDHATDGLHDPIFDELKKL